MFARLFAIIVALAVPVAASVPPPPPPVITLPGRPAEPQPGFLAWQAGPLTCADGLTLPAEDLSYPEPTPLVMPPLGILPGEVTFRFDLDAEGRPLAITSAMAPGAKYVAQNIAPALRASRLPGSGPRSGCSVTYTPQAHSLAEAPLGLLARFGVAQRGKLDRDTWARFAEGDCYTLRRPAPVQLNYPDWRRLQRQKGEWAWTYVRYDIDADGRPTNLATALSSGDPQLDAAGQGAIAANRYAGGPRTGCVHAWWFGPDTVAAPPLAPASEGEGNPACDIADRWERAPRLIYPRPYQNRAVEGWAILRFDVAPWGEIGAVTVLDAQPSSEFGEAAVQILRAAKFKPQQSGLSDCVERVIFRIKRDDADVAESDTPAPVD
jgi:TonB family protein